MEDQDPLPSQSSSSFQRKETVLAQRTPSNGSWFGVPKVNKPKKSPLGKSSNRKYLDEDAFVLAAAHCHRADLHDEVSHLKAVPLGLDAQVLLRLVQVP